MMDRSQLMFKAMTSFWGAVNVLCNFISVNMHYFCFGEQKNPILLLLCNSVLENNGYNTQSSEDLPLV